MLSKHLKTLVEHPPSIDENLNYYQNEGVDLRAMRDCGGGSRGSQSLRKVLWRET
jgi:hypothetical protein